MRAGPESAREDRAECCDIHWKDAAKSVGTHLRTRCREKHREQVSDDGTDNSRVEASGPSDENCWA